MVDAGEIVTRLNQRPDHEVVDYREVGLPTFSVQALVTLQEQSPLGAIHEFVLRCLRAEVTTTDGIAEFLGLPRQVVSKQLGALTFDGAVAPDSDGLGFLLTKKGSVQIDVASKAEVVNSELSINVDGLTRLIIPIERHELYTERQLTDQGVTIIPPMPRRPPKGSELDIRQLNRVFDLLADSERPTRRALKVEAIVGRTWLVYRKAICLAFKSRSTGKIAVSFAIDGRISEDHEIAFARSAAARTSKLFGQLLDSNRRRREVQAVNRHIREILPGVHRSLEDQQVEVGRKVLGLKKGAREGAISEAPSLVRPLPVHEHPPLLKRALQEAQRRILIISPWIRAAVVDAQFVSALTAALDRDVSITVLYGLGRRDKGERRHDEEARAALEGLGNAFPNFTFLRKGNTHAKVLIVDSSFCVTTSFNWLSFKGDPDQPFREEWGTYIEGEGVVDKYFDQMSGQTIA